MQLCHGIIYERAQTTQIHVGTLEEWNAKMKNVPRHQSLHKVCLWIDSCDFPVENTGSRKAPDSLWSYKLNHAGLRYMFVQDAEGLVRHIIGPYPPKVYDSELVSLKRDEFIDKFKDAGIIGDEHFHLGTQRTDGKVEFITPISQPRGRKRTVGGKRIMKNLADEQLQHNSRVHALRSRVESCFGLMKQKFDCLTKCFVNRTMTICVWCGLRALRTTIP